MIWNGWVLVLIIGQVAVVAVNAAAFVNAVRIVRRWDTTSLSAYQLDLEHRSELVATVVSWGMVFQVFSLVVFEITARSLAPFIPGAMCTTGTLQAHYLGWPVLFVKMGALYLYGWWIVINHVDTRVEGFPLTRLKNWYMIALFPVMLADLSMQVAYFTGLDPSVISSCCGVLFEVGAEGFGSSVASLPPVHMRIVLAIFVVLLIVWALLLRRNDMTFCKVAYAGASFAGLILGSAAVIAFVAPYVYMMPALHCPFIFLDQEHLNYGYCVYVPLFGASFLGTSLGILYGIGKRFPSTRPTVDRLGRQFLGRSATLWALFLLTAYAPAVKFWIEAGGKADLFQGAY
jgi:hypothetical protein